MAQKLRRRAIAEDGRGRSRLPPEMGVHQAGDAALLALAHEVDPALRRELDRHHQRVRPPLLVPPEPAPGARSLSSRSRRVAVRRPAAHGRVTPLCARAPPTSSCATPHPPHNASSRARGRRLIAPAEGSRVAVGATDARARALSRRRCRLAPPHEHGRTRGLRAPRAHPTRGGGRGARVRARGRADTTTAITDNAPTPTPFQVLAFEHGMQRARKRIGIRHGDASGRPPIRLNRVVLARSGRWNSIICQRCGCVSREKWRIVGSRRRSKSSSVVYIGLFPVTCTVTQVSDAGHRVALPRSSGKGCR